jgi:hypothetical protein
MTLYQVGRQEVLLYVVLLSAAVLSSSLRGPLNTIEAAPTHPELVPAVLKSDDMISPPSSSSCDSPFGTVLGWANGVPAFSNCNDHFYSDKIVMTKLADGASVRTSAPSAVDVQNDARDEEEEEEEGKYAFTGVAWQCVEYARRYLWATRNVTFADVDGAEDIFSLHFASNPLGNQNENIALRNKLRAFRNGAEIDQEDAIPREGDVMIWSRQEGMPHGHVGIVVGLQQNPHPLAEEKTIVPGASTVLVLIADQNYRSVSWGGLNYSTVLSMRSSPVSSDRRPEPTRLLSGVTVADPNGYAVLGWMRVIKSDSQEK